MALVADSGPVTSEVASQRLRSSIKACAMCWSVHTGLQAIDGLIAALGLVALGDHRRDALYVLATSLSISIGSCW